MVENSDLHTHSYYSDGLFSPKELVRLAKKRGIKNLALTDHNSVKGVKEAIKEGKRIGVNVIPAVEIVFDGGEILGYFIDVDNKTLIKGLKGNSKKEEIKAKDFCKNLEKGGYNLNFKDVQKKFPKSKGNFNCVHPLYFLTSKGHGSMKELIKLLFDKNRKKRKIKQINAIKAIKLIKKAGGVPVLAHPWLDFKKTFNKIGKYVKLGLKGIEINNGDNLEFMKKISGNKDIVNRIRRSAKKYNLILTKGTDFHSEGPLNFMPGNHRLGKNNCDEKIVNKLRKLALK